MTFHQEFSSWFAPPLTNVSPAPDIGARAPSTPQLRIPAEDGKPIIVTFLRHCGCPFAEDTFLNLREIAASQSDVHCYAVSHSSQSSTDKWAESIGGTNPSSLTILVDPEREIYARWGLGASGWLHVLSPAGLYGAIKLGREKGIWNRPTESGSRWQMAGSWAVDGDGIVRWGGPAGRADEVPSFEKAVEKVSASNSGTAKL